MAGYASQLTQEDEEGRFTYVLVRAVFCPGGVTDPNLMEFDARSATTVFPAQYLWGPGPRAEAIAWLDDHQPEPDLCDYLDQVVLVRVNDGHVYLPMYPGVAAGLPRAEQDGTWYALRVDRGLDGLAHVRAIADAGTEHARDGECSACPVEMLASGDLTTGLDPPAARRPARSFFPSLSFPSCPGLGWAGLGWGCAKGDVELQATAGKPW